MTECETCIYIIIKLLDENVRDPQADGATPLFVASWNGHVDVLRTLLRAGADVNKAMVRCAAQLSNSNLRLCGAVRVGSRRDI